MFDPSPFANPTPLAHADTSRDVLPRGRTLQLGAWTASPNYPTNDRTFEPRRISSASAASEQRVFSGTGLEHMTLRSRVRYLDHQATAATVLFGGKLFETVLLKWRCNRRPTVQRG
ncbi:hypothetical protein TNCV_3051411 [Trichonephila clavipes]|nr:hypothetical protein TNCV_3051411 [Trichonephila clavipes]